MARAESGEEVKFNTVVVSGATFSRDSARNSGWKTVIMRAVEHRGHGICAQLFTDNRGHGCWLQFSRRVGKGMHETIMVMVDGRASFPGALRAAMDRLGTRVGKQLAARFYDQRSARK